MLNLCGHNYIFMKLKINKFPFSSPLLLLVTLVLIFTYIASSLSIVHSQAAAPMKPEDEAKLYQGYKFLEACAGVGFDSDSKTRESLEEGSAFDDTAFTNSAYRVGYLVDPNDGDGVFGCEDEGNVRSAMAAVGMTGTELFIDSGIYTSQDGGSGFRLADGNDGDRRNRITGAIRNKYPGIQLSDKASHLAQYFTLAKTFDKHCVASWDGSGNREVQWVNGDGTVAARKFFQRDTGSSGFNVGFGMDEDGGDDGSMQCDTILNQLNKYAGAAGSAQAAYATATGDTSLSTTSNTEPDNDCESNGGPLGWIMCPVAAALDSITGFLDDQIEDKLQLRDQYFRDESGDRLKAAWTQIRNIAYVVLLPIMLVMVIGTALGFEIFSAYTVKKALPRMIIAIIFITLSWYICLFIVEFVNALGAGIKGLVIYPFREVEVNGEIMRPQPSLREALNQARVTVDGGSSVGSTASAVGLGIAGAGAVYAGFATGVLGISVIMSTLFTAALILGAIFLLLIARQMILIALFLLAPLAILAWIFPGNDKLWKLWWSAFTKLLLLFPVIMLSIAVGQIFALIVGLSGGVGNDLIETIMIIAAYILPYFFIPFLFKWAGGLFGNLAGMVNDRERGVLDRLKKGRAEKRAEGWGKFKAGTGTGFGQRSQLTRQVGTRLGAGAGGGKGFYGFGTAGKSRLDQMNRENAVSQIMKSDAWNGVSQDDYALHAGILLQDMNASKAKSLLMSEKGLSDSEADRAIKAWGASGLGGRAAAIAAGQQLVSTGTGFKGDHFRADGSSMTDLEYMTQTLARASGGNSNTRTALAGFANSEAKKSGNHHLAPGFATVSALTDSFSNNGYGTSNASADTWRDAQTNAWKSGSLYEHANDKPDNLKAHVAHFESELASGDAARVEQAAIFFEELKAMKPNAKGANQDIINNALAANQAEIDRVNSSAAYAVSAPGGGPAAPRTQRVAVRDPADPNNMIYEDRPITMQSVVKDRARTYERPDPNTL